MTVIFIFPIIRIDHTMWHVYTSIDYTIPLFSIPNSINSYNAYYYINIIFGNEYVLVTKYELKNVHFVLKMFNIKLVVRSAL